LIPPAYAVHSPLTQSTWKQGCTHLSLIGSASLHGPKDTYTAGHGTACSVVACQQCSRGTQVVKKLTGCLGRRRYRTPPGDSRCQTEGASVTSTSARSVKAPAY